MNSRLVTTTALIVDTTIDEARFAQHGRIVRYGLPAAIRFLPQSYAHLHSELRDTLDHPYYYFSKEKDGAAPGLYVLYPLAVETPPLSLRLLKGATVEGQELRPSELPLHALIKLLQARYFQSRHSAVATRGEYYLFAQTDARAGVIKCLEITIQGAPGNRDEDATQEFKVIDQVTRFKRHPKDKTIWDRDAFFGQSSLRAGQMHLRPLRMGQVAEWEGDVYVQWKPSGKRATLPYHSLYRMQESRGYLMHHFIGAFISHLQHFGLAARSKQRKFDCLFPAKEEMKLPLKEIGTVYVLDNRLNREGVPLAQYIERLYENFGQAEGLVFEGITVEELQASRPTLVIQDAHKADFEEGGILHGQEDPYQRLYRHPALREVPKQTVTVNPNEAEDDLEGYLAYDLNWDPNWQRRFQVALNELYLKWLVLQPVSVWGRLPYLTERAEGLGETALSMYAFLRKKTVDGVPWHVLLYIQDGQLRVADLTNPEERGALFNLLDAFHLDWERDLVTPLLQRRYKTSEDDVARYDFILGPGQVIEIVDTQEDLLYDYDIIQERVDERETARPIEEFKLAAHYEQLRAKKDPPLAQLRSYQLTLEDMEVRNSPLPRSLLARLEAFDQFLTEQAPYHPVLSYRELTSEVLGDRVADIFELRHESGKIHRGALLGYYQKLGRFLSPKGQDVLDLYEGIWFDDELCYMVGAHQALKDEQPVSHLLRRFDIYRGVDLFDVEQWLGTMQVPFVRPERYTVFPYPFHLLDVYIEVRLRHGDVPELDGEESK